MKVTCSATSVPFWKLFVYILARLRRAEKGTLQNMLQRVHYGGQVLRVVIEIY